MLAPTSLVAVLLLVSSVVSAAGGSSPHRAGSNHRRHSSKQGVAKRVPAASSPMDVHGRQLPGTVQMRKRADGKVCKVRSASASASASSSSAAAAVKTSSVASAAGTTASVVAAAVKPSASSSAVPVVATSAAKTTTTQAYVAPTTTAKTAAAPTTTTAAAAATTTKAASTGSTTNLTPNGNKAGVAGMDSLPWIKNKIGWWYDWNVIPNGDAGSAIPVSMLWGGGNADSTDAARLSAFKSLSTVPTYLLGPNEPDCSSGGGSAGLSVAATATLWNTLIAPMGEKGSLLGSPAMCKQVAETFLTPFRKQISRDWDFTTVHINKNSVAGIKADLDHYAAYGKPLWVTEFACVDDSTSFIPCTDQTEINNYINNIVDILEADSRVMAYAYSDGMGLGSVWPTVKNGALSESGKTYLAAISKYH